MKHRRRLGMVIGLAVVTAMVIAATLIHSTGAQEGPAAQLMQLLGHKDTSIPSVVATVNNETLTSAAYQGELDMAEICVQTPSCPNSQNFQSLGTANVALTLGVDKVLLLQYGEGSRNHRLGLRGSGSGPATGYGPSAGNCSGRYHG